MIIIHTINDLLFNLFPKAVEGVGQLGPTGGQLGSDLKIGVPSEGPHTLAGASPAMAISQSHVAWMAGGEGNVA
ncbi:MAG: hypothetical protein M0R70_15260, partial [Nitrospirae bacterium]|nr:hypothetical protein [Nitrospirota bacterium]